MKPCERVLADSRDCKVVWKCSNNDDRSQAWIWQEFDFLYDYYGSMNWWWNIGRRETNTRLASWFMRIDFEFRIVVLLEDDCVLSLVM